MAKYDLSEEDKKHRKMVAASERGNKKDKEFDAYIRKLKEETADKPAKKTTNFQDKVIADNEAHKKKQAKAQEELEKTFRKGR